MEPHRINDAEIQSALDWLALARGDMIRPMAEIADRVRDSIKDHMAAGASPAPGRAALPVER